MQGPTALAAAGLLLVAVPGTARAQDGLLGLVGGLTATVDLGFGLEFDRANPGDDSLILTTDVLFGLSSVTRTQALALAVGADLEFGDMIGTGGENYLIRPEASFDYIFNNGISELTLAADIDARDVDGSIVDPDGFDATDLIEDDGTLVTTDFAFGVAVGLDRPVGASFDYTREDRSYEDTADPALFDSETETYEAALRLTPNEALTLTATALMSETRDQDPAGTLEEVQSFGLGAEWQATRALGVTARLAAVEITTTAAGMTAVQDGLDGALGLVLARPNGSYRFDLEREMTVNGPIDRLSAGRDLTLVNDASLDVELGFASFDSGEDSVIGAITYSQPTRNGSFDLSLAREAAVSSGNDDIIRTVFSAAYVFEINAISDITIDAGYAAVDEVLTGTETSVTDLGLTYTRALGGDWAFSAGIGLSERTATGAADRSDREAFLTLERTFSFRP